MSCRVFIVDDDDLFAEFLTLLLQEDGRFEVAGRARNGREAIERVEGIDPDIVTMDIDMPEVDGVEATATLLRLNPERRIVVVSSSIFAGGVAEARASGASGYVSKARVADELPDMLVVACGGGSFVALT